MPIIKNCYICKKPFSIPPSHAGKRHTCSILCGAKYKRIKYLIGEGNGYFKTGHACSNFGRTHFRKGQKPSNIILKMAREAWNKKYKGKKRPEKQGANCYLWKGGITPINHAIRISLDYVNWRRDVFERDNYTCQYCGVKNGDGKTHILHAHHMKSFSEYPELRFEISNGKTLCKKCHIKGEYNEQRKRN